MHLSRPRRPRHLAHTLRRVAAGVLAAAALLLALRPPPAGPAEAAPASAVVVAVTDLPAGAVLVAGDLRAAEWPTEVQPDGAAVDPAELVGRALASPVRRGEPVTDARVVGPGLWSQVPAGEVAAPVRLADLAVAGLLRPGDRVDVLATAEGSGTEVVAAGALVLAVPGQASRPDDTPTGPVAVGHPGAGLLVLAVPAETAAGLATATTSATLTVTLGPP
ncbi:Flp pilus assembly protein CpaB [Klenkia sp. LSe6-5]|uniref:Flp pilus assembly protein CpaB n=1 Tax=Klenkia sesuvii TaxID=3103137 RepID=A0ABU8DW57_9ACTN